MIFPSTLPGQKRVQSPLLRRSLLPFFRDLLQLRGKAVRSEAHGQLMVFAIA